MKGQSKYVKFFIFSPVLLCSTNAFIIRQKTTIVSKRLPSCSIETSLHNDMHNLGGNEGPHNTFNINGKPRDLNEPTFGDNYYFNGSSKPMNINQAHSRLRPQAKQTNNSWNRNSYSTSNTGRSNYIDEGNLNEPTFGDNFPGGSASPRGVGYSFRNPSNGNVSQSSSTPTTYGNSSPWNSFNLSDKKKQSSTSFNSSYNQNNVPSYTSSVRNGVPEASQAKNNYLHPDKFFTKANSAAASSPSMQNQMSVASTGTTKNNFLHRDKFFTEANSVPYSSSSRNTMPVEEPTKNNYLHPATYLNKANFGENKGYY